MTGPRKFHNLSGNSLKLLQKHNAFYVLSYFYVLSSCHLTSLFLITILLPSASFRYFMKF